MCPSVPTVSGRAPGGDNGEGALICDGLANGFAVVGLVGNDGERRTGPVEECRQDLRIVDLAAGDDEVSGPGDLPSNTNSDCVIIGPEGEAHKGDPNYTMNQRDNAA